MNHAFLLGLSRGLAAHGLKQAAEEIRLQIPRREFHGWDSALRAEKRRNEKKAVADAASPLEPQASPDAPVEQLTALLRGLGHPGEPPPEETPKDPLDRAPLWSAPSNLSAGDAGSRVDLGQPASLGMV